MDDWMVYDRYGISCDGDGLIYGGFVTLRVLFLLLFMPYCFFLPLLFSSSSSDQVFGQGVARLYQKIVWSDYLKAKSSTFTSI